MNQKINLRDMPELEQRSPSGKFHSFFRNVSLAFGGERNVGTWGGGHPFDFQIRRIPPGAAVCPFHAHIVQWELFIVQRGSGTVRAGGERHAVRAGDCFVHPPGEAHQLINTGAEDLEVFIIADNPQLDAFFYPDSGKWGLRTPSVFFRLTPVDYFEGEDDVPGNVRNPNMDSPVPVPPASAFSSRRTNLEELAWAEWSSPKGKFRAAGKQISLALGAKGRAPLAAGGHPFDVEQGKVPPGATICPFHWHALQWEFYVFTSGRGEFRLGEERFPVEPGDCVMAAPGAAHTFTNTGDSDLLYFLVADDPPTEFWHYPDSGKWGTAVPRKIFRAVDTGYFDGEE